MCDDASAQESPLEIQSPVFLLGAGHAGPLCLAVFSINTLFKEPRLSQPICWGSVEHPGNPDTIQESLLQTGLSKGSRPAVLTLFLGRFPDPVPPGSTLPAKTVFLNISSHPRPPPCSLH